LYIVRKLLDTSFLSSVHTALKWRTKLLVAP